MTDSELIEAVARKVMGWDLLSVESNLIINDIRQEDDWWVFDAEDEDSECIMASGYNGWNPLLYDAHMDMVLAVLAGRKWQMSISHIIGDGGTVISDVWLDGNFHQVFTPRGDIAVQRQENGMTMLAMRRAILRAALEAAT